MKNPNPWQPADNPTLDAFGRRYLIELKNIKFNSHFTRETHCFTATVYLDGERVLKVENDGNGGAHNYYPVHGQSRESFRTMLDEAKRSAYESLDDSIREEYRSLLINNDFATDFALEYVITELLNEHLCLRDMRKLLKGKVAVFDESDGKIYQYSCKPTEENLTFLKNKTADEPCVFLNDIPEYEAMVYWRRAEG